MFGFLIAITTFFNNMRMDFNDRKKVAKKRLEEVKDKVRAQKGLPPEESTITDKPKVVDRALTAILYFISLVVAFFEIIIIFIALLQYILIFLLAIIVIILIFAFLALLQGIIAEKEDFLNGSEKPPTGSSCSQVIHGQLQWTLEELNAKGATLTEYQKNLYRMGLLARDTVSGYGTGKENLKDTADISTKILFQLGVQSTEGSMIFYMDGKDKNILEYPTYTLPDKLGSTFRFMGVKASETVSLYSSDGRMSVDEVTAMRSKYKPLSNPSYDAQYAPYAMTMSVGHMNGKLIEVNRKAKHDNLDAVTRAEKIAKDFGIVANKDEFVGLTLLMLAQAQYHGAYKTEYDGYIGFWAALFALSSADDTKRSFSNYEIRTLPTKGVSYAESSPNRQNYIGTKDHKDFDKWGSYQSITFTDTRSWGIYLNGTLIDKPLWNFVGTNTPNKKAFEESWRVVNEVASSSGGIRDRVLNFHYGLNSFWQGKRVENDLAGLMSLGGQTKSEMVCTDGTTKAVTPGNFTATPGKSQVVIDGKPLREYMDAKYSKYSTRDLNWLKGLEAKWGTSSYLQNPDNPAKKAGYVDKIHGVPFFGQQSKYKETWGTDPWVPGGKTFYNSACMIYAYAYASSALLGILVTPAEMAGIMYVNGGLVPAGVSTPTMPSIFKQLGLQAKNAGTLDGIDETLDKGGVIVIRTQPGDEKFTTWEHFQVLTGKEVVDGKTMYHMYTSSFHEQSSKLYTLQQIDRNMGYHENNPVMHVWK